MKNELQNCVIACINRKCISNAIISWFESNKRPRKNIGHSCPRQNQSIDQKTLSFPLMNNPNLGCYDLVLRHIRLQHFHNVPDFLYHWYYRKTTDKSRNWISVFLLLELFYFWLTLAHFYMLKLKITSLCFLKINSFLTNCNQLLANNFYMCAR